jgi:hypothetical protein
VSTARTERQALAAWGRTVTLAWLSSASGAPRLAVATSHDAAATFDAPVDLGPVGDAASLTSLDAAVGAPATRSLSAGDRVQVWVRLARAGGDGHAWRSQDGGRRFEVVPVAEIPAGTLDDGWKTGLADPTAVSVLPPRALRAAGARRVTSPGHAVPGRPPAAVLDDHGALALAWPERGDAGLAIVLRRAWVDWNGTAADARPFDAPFVIARDLPDVSTPLLAAVPGGVVVAWAATGTDGVSGLHARRVGLDMTCTSEQAGHPAPPPAR